jgi:hypothetical protein
MVTYETGISSSPADLFAKLQTFLNANGWVVQPATTGIVVWNGSGAQIFAGINATATSWQTRGCLGYNADASFNAQPNNSGITHTVNLGAGPFTAYHFYIGDEGGFEYIHVTVEVIGGVYRHWALGQLVPFGVVQGGIYCDSTNLVDDAVNRNNPDSGNHRYICDALNGSTTSTAHIHVDYDGKSNNWQPVAGAGTINADQCVGSMRVSGLLAAMQTIGYQRWNLRTPLWPLIYFANRPSSLRSAIGRVPNLRQVSLNNFVPGDIVSIGGENWQVFPVFQRQSGTVANTVVSSGLYGYAHRR